MNEDENDSLLTTWMADIEKCEHVNELPLAMHGVILEHVHMTKSWKSNKFQIFSMEAKFKREIWQILHKCQKFQKKFYGSQI